MFHKKSTCSFVIAPFHIHTLSPVLSAVYLPISVILLGQKALSPAYKLFPHYTSLIWLSHCKFHSMLHGEYPGTGSPKGTCESRSRHVKTEPPEQNADNAAGDKKKMLPPWKKRVQTKQPGTEEKPRPMWRKPVQRKRDYEKLWGEVTKALQELYELVEKFSKIQKFNRNVSVIVVSYY